MPAPHHCGSNNRIDQYNLVPDRVAAGNSRVRVAVAGCWNLGLRLDADMVHPYNADLSCLAETVIAAARATLDTGRFSSAVLTR